ncbi:MAG: hypothetical protein HY904_14955 [Deltaproteobacteria bacterium]|nr:hypothetical protein [Deltaproteobacteria bacterium]
MEKSTQVPLVARELRILVQSLTNCLATCKVHDKKPDSPCEDCDAARTLRTKLQALAGA